MSELKIMSHLGPHLNVVNLLGACTKGGTDPITQRILGNASGQGLALSTAPQSRDMRTLQLEHPTPSLDRARWIWDLETHSITHSTA